LLNDEIIEKKLKEKLESIIPQLKKKYNGRSLTGSKA
jgi:hypothetical protein